MQEVRSLYDPFSGGPEVDKASLYSPECPFLLDYTKPEFLVNVTAESVPLLPLSAH